MAYRISSKAIEDISDIWIYTFQKWSQKQADRYHNLLTDEFEYISTHFEGGRSLEHIKPGYRSSKVKSHVVFYKRNSNGVTEIIRVLHQNMEVADRLE